MRKSALIALFAFVFCGIMNAQNVIAIAFKYDRVTTETTQTADGKIEKKTIDYGQSDFDLQLRDIIAYKLGQKKYTVVGKAKNGATIVVKLHSVLIGAGSYPYYSVNVEVYDDKDGLINRKLVRGFALQGQDTVDDAAEHITNFIIDSIRRR